MSRLGTSNSYVVFLVRIEGHEGVVFSFTSPFSAGSATMTKFSPSDLNISALGLRFGQVREPRFTMRWRARVTFG